MAQASVSESAWENPPVWHRALVALGGNVASQRGAPIKTIQEALSLLAGDSVHICAVSRFFTTPCFPEGAGPDYTNGAAILSTTLSCRKFLDRLHEVEAVFGRERRQRWARRTLDLDLLAYDAVVHPDPETFQGWHDLPPEARQLRAPDELILPHPRLQERAFVLVPLADIAPDWRHPVLGSTVLEMLARLSGQDVAQVVPMEPAEREPGKEEPAVAPVAAPN